MPVMVFGYEFEDVIDVHLDLFYQFGFEDDVVVDDLLVGFLMRTPLLVEIDVQALVVLQSRRLSTSSLEKSSKACRMLRSRRIEPNRVRKSFCACSPTISSPRGTA